MSTTLASYNQEIIPKFLALAEGKELLKDKVEMDTTAQDFLSCIKALQDDYKEHLEDKYPQLVREIKDLETDIKLACKAAAKGTQFKAADLKGFFSARAKLSVSKVIEKGDMFAELDKELA